MSNVKSWAEMLVAVGVFMFAVLNYSAFGNFVKDIVSSSVGLVSGVATVK